MCAVSDVNFFFYVSDSVLLTAHFLCDVSTSLFVALPHFFYIVASLQRLSESSFAHLYIQEALQRLIKFAVFSFHFLMEGIEPPDVSPIWLWGWEVTAYPYMALIFSGDHSAHTLLWQESFIAHCLVWRGEGAARLKECPLPFVHLDSLASALDLCLVFLPPLRVSFYSILL